MRNERRPARRRPRARERLDSRPRGRRGRERLCRLEGDRLVFTDRINRAAAIDVGVALASAARNGVGGLTLDLTNVHRAYPEGVLPVIGYVERAREAGLQFDLVPPRDRRLAHVFEALNWNHFLCPLTHEPSLATGRDHLPLRRYRNAAEQQALVDDALELALHQLEVPRSALSSLEWSLNEITDNVLVHAEAPDGGLVQVETMRDNHRIQFAVLDRGRGVLASMREAISALRSDREAIGEALKQGVTRDQEVGQGNGLAGALRISSLSGGTFAMVSGRGEVRLNPGSGGEPEQRSPRRHADAQLDGTMVFVELRTDRAVDLENALDFGGGSAYGSDYIDARYAPGEEGIITLAVADECVGFGARSAGRGFRTKVENLLLTDDTARVVLDWTGIPLISSSFADEVVGRLFAKLGPVAFSARIGLTGVDPIVRKLIDKAVMQRASLGAE